MPEASQNKTIMVNTQSELESLIQARLQLAGIRQQAAGGAAEQMLAATE